MSTESAMELATLDLSGVLDVEDSMSKTSVAACVKIGVEDRLGDKVSQIGCVVSYGILTCCYSSHVSPSA